MKKYVKQGAYCTDIVYGINGNAVENNMAKGDKADNKKASLLLSAIYKIVGKKG